MTPFGPAQWTKPIKAGYDPGAALKDFFSKREPNRRLPADAVARLTALHAEISTAVQSKKLRKRPSGTVAVDRTNLGEAVEATAPQLRELDPAAYPGLHNSGHVRLANLSTPNSGVMTSTVTAIRDQVFWQWHKFIDDVNAAWQDTQPPHTFTDAPKATLRNGLQANSTDAWQSPDIILCRTADLPPNADPQKLGQQLFGGAANWAKDFTKAQATAGQNALQTVDELVTALTSVNFNGKAVRYQTHEPFSYFIRVENTATKALDLTVRIFLAPATHAHDRRAWMEMDKFLLKVPKGAKVVAYRPDTESSIVKRPAETDPTEALAGGGDPNENAYCDCGWPYTLLLPRGTEQGMNYRLLVMCTDAAIDKVASPEHCGSMSYCGAVDRYPDTRDMGYPFNRPFQGPAQTAIRDKLVQLSNAAARTVRIRHAAA